MGNDNRGLVNLAQALTYRIEHIFSGGSFAGHWSSALPFNRLIYVFAEGSSLSTISDQRQIFEMRSGHWLFIPAGHGVRHDQHEGLKLISIHFSFLYYSNPGVITTGNELHQGNAPELKNELETLAENSSPGMTEVIHLQKLLCGFMLPILEKEKKDLDLYFHELKTFQILFDLFQKDLRRNFTVEDMAKVMKMGRESFVKKFKAGMKTSPKKFFNRLRAAAMASHLRTSSATLREIAEEFGFSNEFYFSRFIKHHLGISPRQWRGTGHLRI